MASALPACRSAASRCSCSLRMADRGESANHSSRRLLTPFEVLHPVVSATHPVPASGSHQRPRQGQAATPMSVSCSSAHTARRSPRGRRRYPSTRAHPWRLDAFGELYPREQASRGRNPSKPAHGADLSARRVCFTPTTLVSFDLQGFDPAKAHPAVSDRIPPLPFCEELSPRARLRRFDRFRDRESTSEPGGPETSPQCPHGLTPRRRSLPLP